MLSEFNNLVQGIEEATENIKLSKCILFGEHVMSKINHTSDSFSNKDIIVLSLYRKILEQLDSIYLLIEHHSYSGAVVVLRSLFESSANFAYLLIDEDKSEERSNYYYVGYAMEEIKICKMILNGEIKVSLSPEKLQNSINGHEQNLNGKLKNEYRKWVRAKDLIEKKTGNPDIHPHWYSLFGGPRSLKGLSEQCNLKDVYDLIYSNFSLEAHGYTSLSALRKTSGGDTKFLPLRSSEPLEVQTHLGIKLFSMGTAFLIKNYLSHLLHEFEEFLGDLNRK